MQFSCPSEKAPGTLLPTMTGSLLPALPALSWAWVPVGMVARETQDRENATRP
jgi:hypothetical protein